jgi:hypothetical protein
MMRLEIKIAIATTKNNDTVVPPPSTGDMFQESQWMPETSDSTKY